MAEMCLLGFLREEGSLCMFLVPLAHDPDTVGVIIISPLIIGLMDEQVSHSVLSLHIISAHKREGVQAVQNWSESCASRVFQ